MSLRKRFLSIMFWSVVSAAFLGPGTITTATKAGVFYNFELLWALAFSTFAALLLQEASARLAIQSKLNLGEAIAKKFEGVKVRITIEPLYGKDAQPRGHIPTPEEEYEGFELFKRRMFSLFKIS